MENPTKASEEPESSTANGQTIRVAALYAYPNNHSTITLERLQQLHPNVRVQFYYWHDFPGFRKNNNWRVPAGAVHLKLARPIRLIRAICRIVLESDVAYFQSFSTPRVMMPLLLFLLRIVGKPNRILIASEGLKKRPSRLRKFVLSNLFNSPRITHLGIGAHSSQDFYDLGLTRWSFRKYCFNESYSAAPHDKTQHGDKLVLLSVGQLIDRKDPQRLLEIISQSPSRHRMELHLAGDGELRDSLEQQCQRLGLSEQVHFHGHCNPEKLRELFSMADAFILLSKYDGWGVVVNQAISFGLPCILSTHVRAGRGYLVDDQVNGFLCETDSQVTNAIERLVADTTLRQEMSEASVEKAELWNLDVSRHRLAQFLEDPTTTFASGPLSSVTLATGKHEL